MTDNSAPNLSATNSFVVTVRPPLLLSSIRRTGSRVEVNWEAIPGTEYKLHYKTNLVVGEWSELPGGVTATSTTASLQDSTSDPARFYRVVALSPMHEAAGPRPSLFLLLKSLTSDVWLLRALDASGVAPDWK